MSRGTDYDKYVNVKQLDDYIGRLDDIIPLLGPSPSNHPNLAAAHNALCALRDAIDADRFSSHRAL